MIDLIEKRPEDDFKSQFYKPKNTEQHINDYLKFWNSDDSLLKQNVLPHQYCVALKGSK